MTKEYVALVKKYIIDVKNIYGFENIPSIFCLHKSPPALPMNFIERINEIFNNKRMYNSMNNATSQEICKNYIHDLYLKDIGFTDSRPSVYNPLITAIEQGAILFREGIYIDVGDSGVVIK